MKCDNCDNPATIKHHLSYFPEVTTGVCESCHNKIHCGRYPHLTKKYIKYKKGDAQLFYQGQNRVQEFLRGKFG